MRMFLLPPVLLILWGCCSAQQDEEEEVPSTHKPRLLSAAMAVEATAGRSVIFKCDVEDLGDYVLLWKREKNNILFAGDLRINRDERLRVEGTNLHVNNVQVKDSGEYTCQISTNPPLELSHSLDVQYPPTVKARDETVTGKEGESVTLTCDATGNPIPEITWKHAGRHYGSSEESSYIISNAQKNNSGEYECIAGNGIGHPASAIITLDIVAAPKIFPEPENGLLVVKEGETISISCRATGDPKPYLSWKKPGEMKMTKMEGEKSSIIIPDSTQSHAGIYECMANNSLGITNSALIRVQVLYAPKVHMSHSKIYAQEGASIDITCMAEGEPTPTVTWKKDGIPMSHSGEHHQLKVHGHAHKLMIPYLRERDFGNYECMASTSLGSSTGSTHLLGTPQVPMFTSKPHGTQGTKYTVSWTVKSHMPITEYSLMYRKSGTDDWETKTVPANPSNEEEGVDLQMFQLTELEPTTQYETIVKAKNKFGWSEPSEALVFATKTEETAASINGCSSPLLNFSLSTLLLLVICSKFWH